jgi:hypothetical protein
MATAKVRLCVHIVPFSLIVLRFGAFIRSNSSSKSGVCHASVITSPSTSFMFLATLRTKYHLGESAVDGRLVVRKPPRIDNYFTLVNHIGKSLMIEC